MRRRRHRVPLDQLDIIKKATDESIQQSFGTEINQLVKLQGQLNARAIKAEKTLARFRASAEKKEVQESQNFRSTCIKIIRFNMRTKGLSMDEIFEHFDTKGEGEVTRAAFIEFFTTADKNIGNEDSDEVAVGADGKVDALEDAKAVVKDEAADDDDDDVDEEEIFEPQPSPVADDGTEADLGDEFSAAALGRLFVDLSDGHSSCSKDDFLRCIKLFYKCVKETAVTDGLSLKESKVVRRLEVKEVVEILEGPVKDDGFDVMRVRAKALKDSTEGWITLAGNRGTAFLAKGGHLFKVIKETTLTRNIRVEEGGASKDVPVGSILEMHEVPREEPESGLTRMKAKVQSDHTVGWVTTMEPPKKMFVEVL